ncbi:uncharacterized protein N0V89_000890 [Didymosphaeria variabile]|uniref:Uncharacterized protein n=1 Tax=Didymosphaeria variabile TaxID=1932322 RepID=A0A9W8XVI5_9PLEO|nr:uncharacterized protein N0V89_000890 [Didymosphaeria variabile]KAJ4360328.1 hypothetical protein N0V89_000890 [Didymosphaeria variabile]
MEQPPEADSAESRGDFLPKYDIDVYNVITRLGSSSPRIDASQRVPSEEKRPSSTRSLKKAQYTTANAEKVPCLGGDQSSHASVSPARSTPARSSFETDLNRSASPITSANDASQNGQDAPIDVDDNEEIEGDEDLNTGDETDTADTISVPINYKDASGITNEYHLDINETELIIGQARGYAYIGNEHQETDEEAIAREKKESQTNWMTGWLVHANPEKYQVKPKKFVPSGKGKGGGRWVDVDEDDKVRVVVEWKKALYRDRRWFVNVDVEEIEERRTTKLGDPPLQYKLEVPRPKPPQSGLLRDGDELIGAPRCLAGPSKRCQPPLMGKFSVEQRKRYAGKEWPARRIAEMNMDGSR